VSWSFEIAKKETFFLFILFFIEFDKWKNWTPFFCHTIHFFGNEQRIKESIMWSLYCKNLIEKPTLVVCVQIMYIRPLFGLRTLKLRFYFAHTVIMVSLYGRKRQSRWFSSHSNAGKKDRFLFVA
jgi:hypothetical protein